MLKLKYYNLGSWTNTLTGTRFLKKKLVKTKRKKKTILYFVFALLALWNNMYGSGKQSISGKLLCANLNIMFIKFYPINLISSTPLLKLLRKSQNNIVLFYWTSDFGIWLKRIPSKNEAGAECVTFIIPLSVCYKDIKCAHPLHKLCSYWVNGR